MPRAGIESLRTGVNEVSFRQRGVLLQSDRNAQHKPGPSPPNGPHDRGSGIAAPPQTVVGRGSGDGPNEKQSMLRERSADLDRSARGNRLARSVSPSNADGPSQK